MKTAVLETLYNKEACRKACNFTKKRHQHRCFPANIAKFLKTLFYFSINQKTVIIMDKFVVSRIQMFTSVLAMV